MTREKNRKAKPSNRNATSKKGKTEVTLTMKSVKRGRATEPKGRNQNTSLMPSEGKQNDQEVTSSSEIVLPAANENFKIECINLFERLDSNEKVSSILTTLSGKEVPHSSQNPKTARALNQKSIFETKADLNLLLSNIINLICRSCGSVVEIQPWQVEENVDSTLEEVFSRIEEDTTDAYVVGGSELKHKYFRRNYAAFWKALIHSFNGLEIDSFLDAFTPWMLAMTESKSRAFRHSSSIAAFNIISGLLERITQMAKVLDDAPTHKKSIQKELDALNTLAFNLYAKAFVRRVRDVHLPIRALAIDSLQAWTCTFPSEYLKPEYTKNFGFLLHDKHPEIRRKTLDALSSLYATENEEHDGLRRFTDRFREHIIELTRDIDPNCVAPALSACKRLLQYDYRNDHVHSTQENYPKEKMDMVLRTIFDEKPMIRHAAGSLFDLVLKLNSTGGESQNERVNMRVESLLRFITEARDTRKIPGAAWYVVDALFHATGDASHDAKRRKPTSRTKPSTSVLFLHHQEIAKIAVSDSESLPITRSAFEVVSALASKLHSNPVEACAEEYNADSLIELTRKVLDMYSNIREIIPSITAILPHIHCQNISTNSSSLLPLLHLLNTEFERTSEYAVLNDIASFYAAILPLTSATNQGVRDIFQELLGKVLREAMNVSDTASWRRAHALYRIMDLGELRDSAAQQLQALVRVKDVSTSHETIEKIVALAGCLARASCWSLLTNINTLSLGADGHSPLDDSKDVLFEALRLVSPLSPSHAVGIFLGLCDLISVHDVHSAPEKYASIPALYCSLVQAIVCAQIDANTHLNKELKKKDGNMLEHASLVHAETNAARRTVEIEVGKLTTGVTRLVKVGALPVDAVAEVIHIWPRMPSKRLSDAVKDLFHFVKRELHHNRESRLLSSIDARESPFTLGIRFELNIIQKSHAVLKENDQSPSHLNYFQNLCYRLAQTHFMPQTDESRRAVMAIVHALLQSVSENPVANAALVCAVLPYTSRIPSEKLQELTHEFTRTKLPEVPEYYRLLFVSSIRKRLPAEFKGTQESIQNAEDEPGSSQPGPTAETFVATPHGTERPGSFPLQDLSLGQGSPFFDKDMLIGSMDTLLATAQSTPHSAPMSPSSHHLVDTVARPSGNAEQSSLIVGEEASEYLLESQVLYE